MTKQNFCNAMFVGITIFGTLVGAGFASGKEIWFYFARFGSASIFSAILVCVLFFFSCLLFFSFGKTFQIKSVQEATFISFGKLSSVMEIFLVLSNLAMLSSMFAGADSLFEIVVPNFPYRLAGVLSAFVCILVVCFGFRGLTKTNAFVVPLLILMIVLVFVFEAKSGTSFQLEATNPKQFSNSILFSLLFLGSNMFFAGFVFSRIGKEYKKKEIVLGSLIGSILLFLALLFLLMLLFLNPTSFASNMPVVDIALSQNLMLGIFSLCVIWLGLLTTSFAMLYTISNWLKTYFGSPILMTTLASLVALVFSGIGFNLFIQVVYPILGFFGFVFMLFVFLAKKRTKKSKQKKHPKGAFVGSSSRT